MKKSEKDKGRERAGVQKKQIMMIVCGAILALVIITAAVYLFGNPSGARNGDTVAIYYSGALDNGTMVETNFNATPLIFTLGDEGTLPYGLSDTVTGMQPGDTRTVVLPAARAFGVYNPSLVQVVNRSSLPVDAVFVAGQDYEIVRSSDKAIARVRILNVTDTTIGWDANHALAGENITLTVNLIRISRA